MTSTGNLLFSMVVGRPFRVPRPGVLLATMLAVLVACAYYWRAELWRERLEGERYKVRRL